MKSIKEEILERCGIIIENKEENIDIKKITETVSDFYKNKDADDKFYEIILKKVLSAFLIPNISYVNLSCGSINCNISKTGKIENVPKNEKNKIKYITVPKFKEGQNPKEENNDEEYEKIKKERKL
jgi:hypothetical protein